MRSSGSRGPVTERLAGFGVLGRFLGAHAPDSVRRWGYGPAPKARRVSCEAASASLRGAFSARPTSRGSGRSWVVYVEARDQRGQAALSGTGVFEGVLTEGSVNDAGRGIALSVALELAERLVADGYVIPPDPGTCVVRVPVPNAYRSEAA